MLALVSLMLCLLRSAPARGVALGAGGAGLRAAGRAGAVRTRPMAMAVVESAATVTLDERLVADEPSVVVSSLQRRRASEEVIAAVDRIGELTRQRAALVEEGNAARAERKALSPKIGALLKAGDEAGAAALKEDVAKASEVAGAADAKVEEVEAERGRLFATLPNLLDSRTPDGADEEANVILSEWAPDGYGELRDGLTWHDELATALGGLDLEAASPSWQGLSFPAPPFPVTPLGALPPRRRPSCPARASRCCGAASRGWSEHSPRSSSTCTRASETTTTTLLAPARHVADTLLAPARHFMGASRALTRRLLDIC